MSASDIIDSDDIVEVTVWSTPLDGPQSLVEVLSFERLADFPEVLFELSHLTDAQSTSAESELGDRITVANPNLWKQNIVAPLESHTDASRPVLILDAAVPIELSDEAMLMLLDFAEQKDALFVLSNQNAFGLLAETLAGEHRLLGILSGVAMDSEEVFEEVVARIDAAVVVSVPAAACAVGQILQGKVVISAPADATL